MATIIPIIDRCNQNCLFCSAKGRKTNLSLTDIRRLVDTEKDLVVISGGEPLLSKRLRAILRYIKDKNLTVELQSNGTLLTPRLAEELLACGVDLFNINFPSHIEALADKITRTKGHFQKRVRAVRILEDIKAPIRLTHIVNSLNTPYLEEFVNYVQRNFHSIKYIQFSFIKILGNAKKNRWINPRYEEVASCLLRALEKCRQYGISVMVDHIPLCYLPGFEKHHADFIKITKGAKCEFSAKEKIKLKICAQCLLNNYCYGVRKDYVELFGKSETLVKPRIKTHGKRN